MAINQVQSRCKKIQFNSANLATLNMVCASLVNLWLTTAIANNQPTGKITANGYSIEKNSDQQIKHAKKLFDEWRSYAADLLIDEGFAFFSPSSKEYLKQ